MNYGSKRQNNLKHLRVMMMKDVLVKKYKSGYQFCWMKDVLVKKYKSGYQFLATYAVNSICCYLRR